MVHGGRYASAAEAALAYARRIGAEASAREAQQQLEHVMTREHAIAAAGAEGLTLVTANTPSGYRHVELQPGAGSLCTRPYRVRIRGREQVVAHGSECRPRDGLRRGGQQGRPPCTGMFATPEEAALEAARYWAKYE